MAKYIVTGGAGFIGSNIVEELVKRGEKVRVIDNFTSGKIENLRPFLRKIELIKGDIRDEKAVARAVKGSDFVLHLAALRSVAKSVEEPVETHDVNATGTLNLLIAAKKAGVRRFVYSSTCAAYGDAKKFPQRETDAAAPISPYGASKLAGENYCMVFANTLGLEAVALRYFNVYGPRQNPESMYSSVVPAFIFDVMSGRKPVVEWDGKQSRDFVFVKDVVRANLLAATAKKASGQVFNVGNGYPTAIYDLLMYIEKALSKRIAPKFGPKREGDVRKVYSDISKAKRTLGFKPGVTLEQGLKLTVQWFNKSPGLCRWSFI